MKNNDEKVVNYNYFKLSKKNLISSCREKSVTLIKLLYITVKTIF